jgi:hypothetical protein
MYVLEGRLAEEHLTGKTAKKDLVRSDFHAQRSKKQLATENFHLTTRRI